MKRRDYIKTIILGSVVPFTTSGFGFSRLVSDYFQPAALNFKSNWQDWPDMKWAGPQYWGNRLQDWKIENGKLVCDYSGNFRTLHLLTVQNKDGNAPFKASVWVNRLHTDISKITDGCIGFLLGAKGPFDDYRSAAVFGKGLNIGLTPLGKVKIGNQNYECGLSSFPEKFRLKFLHQVDQLNEQCYIKSFKLK